MIQRSPYPGRRHIERRPRGTDGDAALRRGLPMMVLAAPGRGALLAAATAFALATCTSCAFAPPIAHHRRPPLAVMAQIDGGNVLESTFSSLRSLGVDYGLSRTGIAITTGGYRPRPLAILSGLNATQLSAAIVDYAIAEQASNVVLGLPLHKNGTDSEQSDITRAFAQELLREVRIRCGKFVDLVMWDERYTSKEAASRITAEAMARNQRIPSASDLETELDADAACIILEDYYKERGEEAERVAFDDAAVEAECKAAHRRNAEREEQLRAEKMEERERGRNARKEMMERVRAEEAAEGQAGEGTRRKKKKKKKKKR